MPVPKLSDLNKLALAAKQAAALEKAQPVYNDPLTVKERIRIIADDSSSMYSIGQEMKDGVVEFMKHCIYNETSAAVHLMNGGYSDGTVNTKSRLATLTTNLPALSVLMQKVNIGGSTPMEATLQEAMDHNDATRYIIFSDGEPDSATNLPRMAKEAKERRTPIDTVYISHSSSGEHLDSAGALLKQIADLSGGIFLHYRKGLGNFGKIFGYLAPPMRLMLNDPATKAKVEGGKG